MSERHVIASRARQSKIDPIVRKKRAQNAANVRWSRLDAGQRREYAMKMVNARNRKVKVVDNYGSNSK